MKILFHANCQGWALEKFFKYSPDADKFQTKNVQTFMLELGTTSLEEEREFLNWADTMFYMSNDGRNPRLGNPIEFIKGREGLTRIPMSTHFNGGYFISWTTEDYWKQIFEYAKTHTIEEAINYAVLEADMGYKKRWEENLFRMKEKETEEGVAESMRLSYFVERLYLKEQQNTTMNHPTSVVLYDWANILLKHLGFAPIPDSFRKECLNNMIIANLPCEDWICTGAKKHLGLMYGATEYEDKRSRELVREKILKWEADGRK